MFEKKRITYPYSRRTRKNTNLLVSKFSIFNSIVLLLIAIFTFQANYQMSEIQKFYSQQQSAKEVERFWSEIEKVVEVAGKHSGTLGSALSEFLISSDKLSSYYFRLKKINSNYDFSVDLKYLGYKAKFISKYAKLVILIETVGVEYDFIRVKFHQLAIANGLVGWKELFTAHEKVNQWKKEINKDITNVYILVSDSTSETSHVEFATYKIELEQSASKLLGSKEFYIAPYLTPVYEFMGNNLKEYGNSIS